MTDVRTRTDKNTDQGRLTLQHAYLCRRLGEAYDGGR